LKFEAIDWWLMRPVLSGKVNSLYEVKKKWTLKDLALFHHFLDVEEEANDHHQKETEREMAKAKKGKR